QFISCDNTHWLHSEWLFDGLDGKEEDSSHHTNSNDNRLADHCSSNPSRRDLHWKAAGRSWLWNGRSSSQGLHWRGDSASFERHVGCYGVCWSLLG
ncbi:hypothetical protein LSTR_LSTR016271, partial [Laodelphax striatellus]